MAKHIIILLVIFSFFSLNIYAQPKKDQNLPSENVEVVKNFEARLLDVERQKLTPVLPPLDTTVKALTYNLPQRDVVTDYPAPRIKPIALKTTAQPKAYNGYVKAGYGIPNSPLVEASYFLSKKKVFDLNMEGWHHSADYKKLEFQSFAKSGGKVSGNYYINDNLAVNGYLGYSHDVVHFYGYDHSKDTFTDIQVHQNFKLFQGGAKIFNSSQSRSDFNYYAGVDYYRLADNFSSVESGVKLSLGAVKWFSEQHSLSLGLRTDFTNYDTTGIVQDLNNFYLIPTYNFHGESFKLKVGGNLISSNDKFYFFPDLEAGLNIFGNQLSIFAGWKGDFQKNTFRSLTEYCPFLLSRVPIRNTSYNDYFGGIKGTVSIFQYNVQAGYNKSKDLAMFINSPADFKRFNVLYDTVNIIYIKGGVTATIVPGLEVGGTVSNNIYSANNQKHAWHLPFLEVNGMAKYTSANQKARVKANVYIENGVPYLDENNVSQRLGPLFDISLGGEYWFHKNIGVFLDLYNLANNKRQRWNQYQTYGLNILGGVTARF